MRVEELERKADHHRLIQLVQLGADELREDRPSQAGIPHVTQNNQELSGGTTMVKFLTDTRLVFGRSLTRTFRNPMWIIVNLFQPLLYLLLFAPLLEGLQVPGFSQTSSLNYFVPGVLIMIAFSAAFFGMNVLDDLRDGVVERLRVTPASRLALLLGMVLQDVLVFLVQCGTLVVVATIMGLRPDWTGMLLLFGLLALIGLTMVSFSYALTLKIQDQGALAGMISTLTVPLLLLSGVLLPMTLAPDLLRTLAQFNPFTHAVDAARALVNGHLADASILRGLGIFAGLAALAMLWAVRIFRRSTA
jgi:ABC-2 type transport system permease protein